VNREERLRRVIPGADDALITALAAKPAAEVDVIVAALRQARRDERQHQADRKRQAKADARNHHHYDSDELAGRNVRLLRSSGQRAEHGDLDALRGLAEFARSADRMIHLAVDGLRARGVSDAEISRYLGCTRQSVHGRFRRQDSLTPAPVVKEA
jgi:hypothetical protein